MDSFDPERHPHRRFNPLTGEWVLVSPQRTQRPWKGAVENVETVPRPTFDPDCYLCPGNVRANGEQNPPYEATYVFTNDFSALVPEATQDRGPTGGLFQSKPVQGTCRVVCFSPRHDLTLSDLAPSELEKVVETLCSESAELSRTWRYVQVFENKGAVMGCSNPHPHGQVWASSDVPSLVDTEDRVQADYRQRRGTRLVSAALEEEVSLGARTVESDEHWVAWVPFWAVWPFETLVAPREPVARLHATSPDQRASLARILKRLLCRYDQLFQTPCPYSMGWHQAPSGSRDEDAWVLHAHVYPPLLRSATVRKFMVGYEMLAEAQRDLTPELAAARLRECPAVPLRRS